MAETAKETKVHGGHKAHFKKLCTAVDAIMTHAFDPTKEHELCGLRDSLKRKSEVILKLDEEILQDIDEDDKMLEEIESAEQLHREIRDKIEKVDVFLSRVSTAKGVKSAGSTTADSKVMPAHQTIKLPKLEIPKFNGDPMEYRAYWDTF